MGNNLQSFSYLFENTVYFSVTCNFGRKIISKNFTWFSFEDHKKPSISYIHNDLVLAKKVVLGGKKLRREKNNVFRHFAFKQCQWLSAMYRLNQNCIKKPFRENEHTKWGRCVATVWVALALILLSTDCSFDRQKNQNHVKASKILPKIHWQKPNFWSKKGCSKKCQLGVPCWPKLLLCKRRRSNNCLSNSFVSISSKDVQKAKRTWITQCIMTQCVLLHKILHKEHH